ncbi:MAG TPA: acetyl-CoA C-acetyltransferase [Bacillota bacterium]|nr:acetyl-CoA C-acetyltransferase [Bacillota bacterium]
MRNVYIIEGKRTAIGKFLGGLSDVKPGEIASQVVKAVISNTGLDSGTIDEVFIGHQHSAGQGPSIARRIQLEAGIPAEVPATTVNMQCGSGMKAIFCGYQSIQAGSDAVLCGGVENMSQVPFILSNKVRKGVKMGNDSVGVQDSLFCDGLIDQFYGYLMGMTAENVAELVGVTREEQDEYAVVSQNRAQAAVESGRFADEIIPIVYKDRKGNQVVFDTDESYTKDTTLEKLAVLQPAFKKDGTVTAGNSSQLNDGAAVILLASEEAVRKNGWKPIGEIVALGQKGIDPSIMGLGPVGAIENALNAAGMGLGDIDLIELNEAFAAQAVGVINQLSQRYDIPKKTILNITNVNGGAIALGHPVAASGTRIVVSLLHEMRKRETAKTGLASLCIGGGMGIALIIRKM